MAYLYLFILKSLIELNYIIRSSFFYFFSNSLIELKYIMESVFFILF